MSQTKLYNKLVLIVEDDSINNDLLVYLLKKVEMRSLCAFNGIEALAILEAHPDIDLVLMDIKMKGINGYELTKRMKDIRPGIIVIAQTAYALEGEREKSIEAGCDEYIQKPIKKDELYTKMASYF